MNEHTSSAKDAKIVASSQKIFKIARFAAITMAVATVVIGGGVYWANQPKAPSDQTARQEEFLARQPKVLELKLPVGKWVDYENKQHKLSYWETKGNGCVALAIDGGRINLVCTYPEQEQTIIWPFGQKMPKATTLLRISKNAEIFQVMNLDNKPDTLVLTLDP